MTVPLSALPRIVEGHSYATFKPGMLISASYLAMQRELHADPRGYGTRGHKWAHVVRELIAQYDASSVLDYGCGQGALVRELSVDKSCHVSLREYDPAVGGKTHLPVFADLVVCTDVLEHIELDRLDTVLRHLRMLARKAVFAVVSTVETAKTLPDGRNAHILLQDATWWPSKMAEAGFTVRPAPESARKKPEKEWIGVLLP